MRLLKKMSKDIWTQPECIHLTYASSVKSVDDDGYVIKV